MGYPASWTPLAGGPAQPAVVLFKAPTQEQALIMGISFDSLQPECEYKEGVWPALKLSVDRHAAERIVIDGAGYFVHSVLKKFDGRTYSAVLQKDKNG